MKKVLVCLCIGIVFCTACTICTTCTEKKEEIKEVEVHQNQ